MRAFLREFTHDPARPLSVIVMDDGGLAPPRQYRLRPARLLLSLGAAAVVLLLVAGGGAFVLLRSFGTAELQQQSRLQELRLAALQDSLTAQHQYLDRLRRLMTGAIDSSAVPEAAPEAGPIVSGELAEVVAEPTSKSWGDHAQPALPLRTLPAREGPPVRTAAREQYLSTLRFPVLPPVNGFYTRGFDARTGHYAVDIAVEEGAVVRAVGDGYVVFADWTQDGGYTLIVQHADGYASAYKHNERLLKRVGDRVRDRDPIAISGNTGEVTSGPHLHFELWQDGLAQDPRSFFIGG